MRNLKPAQVCIQVGGSCNAVNCLKGTAKSAPPKSSLLLYRCKSLTWLHRRRWTMRGKLTEDCGRRGQSSGESRSMGDMWNEV